MMPIKEVFSGPRTFNSNILCKILLWTEARNRLFIYNWHLLFSTYPEKRKMPLVLNCFWIIAEVHFPFPKCCRDWPVGLRASLACKAILSVPPPAALPHFNQVVVKKTHYFIGKGGGGNSVSSWAFHKHFTAVHILGRYRTASSQSLMGSSRKNIHFSLPHLPPANVCPHLPWLLETVSMFCLLSLLKNCP